MDPLDALRSLTVPTLANAVEVFGVVPANAGYNTRPLTCHFPELGTCVGYAATVIATTDRAPGDAPEPIDEPAYWKWLVGLAQTGPLMLVLEDLDDPPGGAMWGEWNGHVHRALGCVGTITQGAVRDLDALERLGFHTFATAVSVAHGYGAFTSYGEPVAVAGLAIATGDLLVADLHGVLRIPPEIPIAELVAAGREIDRLEAEIFACTKADDFSIAKLERVQESVLSRWPRGPRSGAM